MPQTQQIVDEYDGIIIGSGQGAKSTGPGSCWRRAGRRLW